MQTKLDGYGTGKKIDCVRQPIVFWLGAVGSAAKIIQGDAVIVRQEHGTVNRDAGFAQFVIGIRLLPDMQNRRNLCLCVVAVFA